MFDILVYLFESYIHADACPESDLLARKLSAAGFEEEEISEALEWLAGLRRVAREIHPGVAPDARSVRIYTEYEQTQNQLQIFTAQNQKLIEKNRVAAEHTKLVLERLAKIDSEN